MATYKVLQDIEAEDKFLGPLTLKQFIFAAIALVSCYLCFIFITKDLWVLVIPLIPVIIVMGFLAFPWGRDQPTETWLLAKIRFMFKPRKRIWDQTGIQELVKITAPPKVQQYFSDNLSQTEVRSRLKALAETIDSRGWAVKNVNMNLSAQTINGAPTTTEGSDRLVDATTLPQVAPMVDIGAADDIFESPRADKVASAIAANSQQYRAAAADNIKDVAKNNEDLSATPDYWFMNQPNVPTKDGLSMFGTETVHPASKQEILPQNFSGHSKPVNPDEAQVLNEINAHKPKSGSAFRNHKTIMPDGEKSAQKTDVPPVTAQYDPVTMRLAGNNDRVVSSLAKESKKAHPKLPDDEVIISLH